MRMSRDLYSVDYIYCGVHYKIITDDNKLITGGLALPFYLQIMEACCVCLCYCIKCVCVCGLRAILTS